MEKMTNTAETEDQGEEIITDSEAEKVVETTPAEQSKSEEKPANKESKKQSPEENAIWKQRRLEWERRERELSDKLKVANETISGLRSQSVSDEALKDLGLTKDDLKDSDNLRLAELYAEGQKNGVENPAAYAYRKQNSELRNISERERKAREERDVERENARKDREQAAAKYGAEFVSRALNKDSEFMKQYGRILNHENFAVLMDVYSRGSDERARKQGSFAQPGYRAGSSSETDSADDIRGMTDAEFQAFKRKHNLL